MNAVVVWKSFAGYHHVVDTECTDDHGIRNIQGQNRGADPLQDLVVALEDAGGDPNGVPAIHPQGDPVDRRVAEVAGCLGAAGDDLTGSLLNQEVVELKRLVPLVVADRRG